MQRRREQHRRQLLGCEKKIRLQALSVLEKRQAYSQLHKRQQTRRHDRKTMSELSKWRKQFDIHQLPERSLRMPDRALPTRMYTRIDDDLWKMPELRGWFQKHATAHEKNQSVGVLESGYLVLSRSPPSPPEVKTPWKAQIRAYKTNFAISDSSPESYHPLTAGYLLPPDVSPNHLQGECRHILSNERHRKRSTAIVPNCGPSDMGRAGYMLPNVDAR